jgi:hypothetical protein
MAEWNRLLDGNILLGRVWGAGDQDEDDEEPTCEKQPTEYTGLGDCVDTGMKYLTHLLALIGGDSSSDKSGPLDGHEAAGDHPSGEAF